jgi:hypothetical protein
MPADYMRHIRELAGSIGPRPATSREERRAADYVALELEEFADEVAVEEFGGLKTFVWMYVLLFATAALASLTFSTGVMLTFALTLVVLVFMVQEINAKGILWDMMKKADSANVVGVIEATDTPKRRMVIVANHDSGKDGLFFDRKWQAKFGQLVTSGMSIIVLQTTFVLLGLFVGPVRWLSILFLFIAAAEVAVIAVLLTHNRRGSFSPGANDNASGVATLIEVGRKLAADRLPDTEVWLVSTGCGRAVRSGMMGFLRRHWTEVKYDTFLVLNHVGAGTLKYTLSEGLIKVYPCDPDLINQARALAEEHPAWTLSETTAKNEATDIVPLLANGIRAIGLRGEDATGVGVAARLPEDTPDVIDEDTMESAIEFSEALVRAVARADAAATAEEAE